MKKSLISLVAVALAFSLLFGIASFTAAGEGNAVFILGDIDGNEKVTSDDAVYLLRYTLFPEAYPVSDFADFDHNEKITSDDAVYLLRYTLFPEAYPLVKTTPDEYFTFRLLDDETYEIKANNANNMPANVVIPCEHGGAAVTSIGYAAFAYCSGLTNVTIPESVTSISNYAFSYCSGLTSVTIPDGVTSIDVGVFFNCSSLTSITIPESITSIGDGAFQSCSSLVSVTIPDSVTSIGNYAFEDCSGLTEINFTGTITQWNKISKGDYWTYYTGSYAVHCIDGEEKSSEGLELELNGDGTGYIVKGIGTCSLRTHNCLCS